MMALFEEEKPRPQVFLLRTIRLSPLRAAMHFSGPVTGHAFFLAYLLLGPGDSSIQQFLPLGLQILREEREKMEEGK